MRIFQRLYHGSCDTNDMKEKLKKHQELQSPGHRNEKLSVSERERSTNRPRTRKPTGLDVRHARTEKLNMHDTATTSAKQPDQSSKEDVYTGHERIRYASLREVSPNASMGEVF